MTFSRGRRHLLRQRFTVFSATPSLAASAALVRPVATIHAERFMTRDTTTVSIPTIPKWSETREEASRIGMPMSETRKFPNRIRELREARKWSATHLGQLAGGMAGPTVTRLETGERRLKHDQAQAIAQALEVSIEALTGTDGAPLPAPSRAAPTSINPPPTPNARIGAEIDLPNRSTMRRDLPIYGTAAGSDGDGAFFINFGDVVDRTYRPPSLLGNTKAYGLYIEGLSMAPAFDHGSFVVADPTKKVRTGDNVVVIVLQGDDEHAERMAYVKEFVKQTDSDLHLKQHNPSKPLTFPRSRVVPESMHRLLTMAELMGVG
jgi:phage repressor protein C with HTH and peptisase S24 domain